MYRQIFVGISAAVILGGLALVLFSTQMQAEELAADQKVAVVNGTPILMRDLNRQVDARLRQINDKDEKSDKERLLKLRIKVLEELISRELLYQAGVKAGIKVPEEEVEKEVQAMMQQYGDDTAFKQALTKLRFTEDGLRASIRQEQTVRRFIDQEINAKISIPESEVTEYYNKNRDSFKQPEMVRASDILIKVERSADENSKKRAREELLRLKKRVAQGEDFAEISKKFSQGPNAESGGDLGFFSRGQILKPVEDIAFSLELGQVSDVVETEYGFHLIKVTERKPAYIESFQTAKWKIERFLKQSRIYKTIEQHGEKLRKEAEIVRLFPEPETKPETK